MTVTVIICTRNPDPTRLDRVLRGLDAQQLTDGEWDLLVVDNGSQEPVALPGWFSPARGRVIREPKAGLFYARIAAINASHSQLLVFIDDDTVPSPGFLQAMQSAFSSDSRLVAAGPRIIPEFASPPPAWLPEFTWALALRDLGDLPVCWSLADGTPMPGFTPIGAGLALRATALPSYLAHARLYENEILSRSWIGQGCGGNEDKDLVLTLLRAGGRVGYVPDAIISHLIPNERLSPAYFEKLLPGLSFLWMRTLHAHGMPPRPTISNPGLWLRALRLWLRHRAWRRPAPRLRWLLALGELRGRAANHRDSFRYSAPRA